MSALAGLAHGVMDARDAEMERRERNADRLAGQTMPGGFTGDRLPARVSYDDGVGIYAGGGRASSGPKVSREFVVSGLVQRGLAPHLAEGFANNFQDESGFDPGINETSPLVPGSRGGFGLSQWTGPRRRALEQFAESRGVSVSDPDMQLDFLMHELEGPERLAYDAMKRTSSPEQASAVILNRFLRPAENHRARREAKYLGSPRSAPGIRDEPVKWGRFQQGAAI